MSSMLERIQADFAQSEGLPFSEVLTEQSIRETLDEFGVTFRDRTFNPIVTTWAFIGQSIDDDPSCKQAVARVLAHRVASGHSECSANNSAYIQARQKLPEGFLKRLAQSTADDLEQQARPEWKWKGRDVYVVDGSTISMPDTPENQEEYPQPASQEEGIGFPLARINVLLSLSTGACMDLAIAPNSGKGTGERALFRQMMDRLKPGDVVLGDKYYDCFFTVCLLKEKGVDVVFRKDNQRKYKIDKVLNINDKIVRWSKPTAKPEWMTWEEYKAFPNKILMRKTGVETRYDNTRSTRFDVVSTFLDPEEITHEDLEDAYDHRWDGEVDLRSIKQTIHMDILRCKTPEMVRKEIWAHLLAYNLLRTIAAVAADEHDMKPRHVSFKGAKQQVIAFAPKLEEALPERREALIVAMLRAIASNQVGNRRGRWEPRATKRRPKPAKRLTVPRPETKADDYKEPWY